MALAKVVQDLVDVQFYTAKDPYYYTIDNRPLQDLDTNIRKVAGASDASSGSAERAALAAATLAYSQLGYGKLVPSDPVFQGQGMFSADYDTFGLDLRINHGFLIHPTNRGGSPAYSEPTMAVHDAVTLVRPQVGRGGTVQVKYRASTDTDRVASGASPIEVAEVTFKQGTGPGIFPLPDANSVAIMHIDVPVGATQLEDSYITHLNFKSVKETSDVLGTSQIVYASYVTSILAGTRTINLSGSDIDSTRMGSVEVFVQGVNQFNWTFNSSSNQIRLQDPVVENAEVRVRQANLELV